MAGDFLFSNSKLPAKFGGEGSNDSVAETQLQISQTPELLMCRTFTSLYTCLIKSNITPSLAFCCSFGGANSTESLMGKETGADYCGGHVH